MTTKNKHGQPVGAPLSNWSAPAFPPSRTLHGRTVEVVPLDPSVHAHGLFEALSDAPEPLWTYMSFGPFAGFDEFEETLMSMLANDDWLTYSIVVNGGLLGFAAYLRIQPRDGVIELGSITFAPSLQRTTAATEAMFLMIDNVFELGYRRCEWKCDDLNHPSRAAAIRLGFTYEGTFRQATHYKGRNRDTAWYAITDAEWPDLRRAFQEWLAPDNFDAAGGQRRTLMEVREGK